MATFEKSVQAAVAASLAQNKPLLVALTETEELSPDSVLFQAVSDAAELITEQAVALKVLKDSPDFEFFQQIFPVQAVPSLYVIRNGKVVALITGGDSTDQIIDQLTSAMLEEPSAPAASQVTPPASNDQNQAGQPNEQASSQAERPNQARPRVEQPEETPKQSRRQDKGKEKPRSKSTSQQEYQEQMRLQKKAKDEERRRILELVKKDRQEQKAQERIQHQQQTPLQPKTKPNADHHDECALLIRLFDGSPLKNRFKPGDTLETVRRYVDTNTSITDPYHFAQTYPKKTFSVTEEHQSLQELGLVPSATLILKPVSQYVSAYSQSSSLGGWLSPSAWYTSISNGISQYLAVPEQDETSSESSSDEQTRKGEDRNTYNGNQLSLEDNSGRP